ncbi:MAG: cysteine hydrolase [Candidatus Bathyarchaeota archaeon]|nr:cysteine hydrolase [Candidatus Bathyarchaeota archaeon]
MRVVPIKPALLVIDAQNGWLGLSEGLKKSVDEHINNINNAILVFRRAGAPIIFTYHSYANSGIVAGTKEFELFPTVEVKKTDGVIVKTHQNAFNKTTLESMIRDKGCDTVIIVGLSALHCVLATYFGAYDCDFAPYLVRGAVAAPDEESIQMAEKICDTLSLRAIAQILNQDPQVMRMR